MEPRPSGAARPLPRLRRLSPRVAPRARRAAHLPRRCRGHRLPSPSGPGGPAAGERPDVDVEIGSGGGGGRRRGVATLPVFLYQLLLLLFLLLRVLVGVVFGGRRLLLHFPENVLPSLGSGGGRWRRRFEFWVRVRFRFRFRFGVRVGFGVGKVVEGEEDAVVEELVGGEEVGLWAGGVSDRPEFKLWGGGVVSAAAGAFLHIGFFWIWRFW